MNKELKWILIVFIVLILSCFISYYCKAEEIKDNEKTELREAWIDVLGFDLFLPYFKVREFEEYISHKFFKREDYKIKFRGQKKGFIIEFKWEF